MTNHSNDNILFLINLIKSNKEGILEELKQHEEKIDFNDFSCLFNALVYCKDPEVFSYIYKNMNKENSIKFDENFFLHNFSIRYKKDDNIIPQLKNFNIRDEIQSSLCQKESSLTSDDLDSIFIKNKEVIQNNFFSNTDMALFKKPLNELPKFLEDLLSKMIIHSSDAQFDPIMNYIHQFPYNRFTIVKPLFSYFESQRIDEQSIATINKNIFSHLINANEDLINDPILFKKYIEKTLSSSSLSGFLLLINKDINICKPDSKAGITYFDMLLKYSFESMKSQIDAGIYHIQKDSNKKLAYFHFYEEAFFQLTQVFPSFKNSYIFKDEKQSIFKNYQNYAKHFNLDKTLSILERTKIDNQISDIINTHKEYKKRRI